MSDTSLRFDFLRGRDTASPHMAVVAARAKAMDASVRDTSRKTQREVFQVDNVFRNTARRMISHIALIGFAIVGALGHAVAFTQAVWQIVGVLAAVPAVAFASAVGIVTLIAGFSGLFAAMKKSGGGGASLDALAAAERRYTVAQRAAVDAQEALNDARETAADRLRDINVSMARANLDQKEAAQAVRDAQLALREARRSGDVNERRRAELALESALLSQTEVANRLTDVQQEYNKRTTEGVEGSDEVQDALRRQADAAYELAQAQKSLSQGGGGANAQAEAYAKLSVAGKQLVDTLHALSPSWRVFQQNIQQALLANVAGDVQAVSGVLLAQQHHVVGIAGAWNTAIRGVLGYFKSAQGAAALNTTLGNTVTFSQALGRAWEPFVRGFMTFVSAGSEALPRLGAWIEKLANQFADWAARSAQSGKITEWIDKGAKAAADLGHWIRDISGGIGEIFKAGSSGPNYLAQLADDAKRWRDTMGTPEMQTTLATFFAATRDLGHSLWVVIKALTDAIVSQPDIIKQLAGALNVVGAALKFAADNAGLLNTILPPLITFFLIQKAIMLPLRLGIMAVTAATNLWKTAQLLLNGVMNASTIGLVVLAIAALVTAFIYLWNNCEGFRNFWIGLWNGMKSVASGVVDWIKGIPDAIRTAFSVLGNVITAPFRAAFNAVARFWNNTVGQIRFTVPDWPGLPHRGESFGIPKVPELDTGGFVQQSGIAVIHRGEEVVPAAEVSARGGATAGICIDFTGAEDELGAALERFFRKRIRAQSGSGTNAAQRYWVKPAT